jgi:hypothetical protein
VPSRMGRGGRGSQFIHIYEYPSRVEVVIFSYIIYPFPHSNRISFLDNLVILQSLYRIETVMIVFEIGNIALLSQ